MITEAKRQYNLAYYRRNKRQIAEMNRKYRQANKERIAARNLAYAKANRDKANRWQKKWLAKNKAKREMYDHRRRLLEKARVGALRPLESFYASVRSRRRIKCYYCGKSIRGKDAHVDHVIALSRGGNHAVENLAVACATCNRSKCAKLPHEWPRHPQMFFTL